MVLAPREAEKGESQVWIMPRKFIQTDSKTMAGRRQNWGCGPGVECLPGMCEVLGPDSQHCT